jgi:putative endonuclease
MDKKQWIVYLMRCSDESLYCGITNNLKNRLAAHNLGRGAKYTRSRRPIELVGASFEMTKSDALKLEYRVNQVSAGEKIFELIKEELEMPKNLKKNLQTVNRELKALTKKVDQIVVAVGKLEKAKAAKKPKAKAVKRKPAKKTFAKKVAVKKPAAKKTTKTVIDTVLEIIRRSKKGVNTAALMKKTGFNEIQIHNNVYKLKQRGKIKSVGRGVYLKA